MDHELIGMLVRSKAGHDKGQLYVIIEENETYVYLSDGHLKPVGQCKKKNRKHIQIIRRSVEGLTQKLQKGESICNEEIKRAIKLFRKELQESTNN